MTFAEDFKTSRIQADMGLKETAKLMGRSQNVVIRIEAGESVTPRSMARAESILQQMKAIVSSKVIKVIP